MGGRSYFFTPVCENNGAQSVKGSRKVGGNEKEATCEINFRRSRESMARECNRLIKLSSALTYRQFHPARFSAYF